jgi:hypothetical protein
VLRRDPVELEIEVEIDSLVDIVDLEDAVQLEKKEGCGGSELGMNKVSSADRLM